MAADMLTKLVQGTSFASRRDVAQHPAALQPIQLAYTHNVFGCTLYNNAYNFLSVLTCALK